MLWDMIPKSVIQALTKVNFKVEIRSIPLYRMSQHLAYDGFATV